MLLSVEIHSFRSCRQVRLDDMHEMLALVGRNGVGKTNILKAIDWAARIGSTANQIEFDAMLRRGRVTLRLDLNTQIVQYDLQLEMDITKSELGLISEGRKFFLIERLTLENGLGGPQEIFSRNNGDLTVSDGETPTKVGALSPAASTILSLFPDSKFARLLEQFIAFLTAIRYYPIEEIEEENDLDILAGKEYDAWLSTGIGGRDPNRKILLKIVDLSVRRPNVFDELLALLGSDGIGVLSKITVSTIALPLPAGSASENKRPEIYYFLRFAPAGMSDDKEYSFADLSFGTRRIIRLLVSVLYDQASVSLIEQPEDGIHSGLLHKLIPMLRSYSNPQQFLVTSHSTEVINRIDPKEVRLVYLSDSITRVRALNTTEITAACNFMANDGPLSEFIESVQEL